MLLISLLSMRGQSIDKKSRQQVTKKGNTRSSQFPNVCSRRSNSHQEAPCKKRGKSSGEKSQMPSAFVYYQKTKLFYVISLINK
jgi:hypothetical protein